MTKLISMREFVLNHNPIISYGIMAEQKNILQLNF